MSQPIEMPSPQDKAAWIACIKARAKTEIPALLRQSPGGRATVANPVTPFPDITSIPTHQMPYLQRLVRQDTKLPETGGIERIRDTAMISAINLLKPDVRQTRELVSTAIRWFYHEHGCLPYVVGLNPVRYLAITASTFFPVSCEDIGCFTINVESNIALSTDVVELSGRMWPWSEEVTDSYL